MRRILIGRARSKRALRHGGGQVRVDIQKLDLASPDADDQLLAVSDALDKLAAQDPTEAELGQAAVFRRLERRRSRRPAEHLAAHGQELLDASRTWLYHEIRERPNHG